jgi:hypothetical protein
MSLRNDCQRSEAHPAIGPSAQESYLSAIYTCGWDSFVGWITPLAIFLLVGSKLWMADGTWLGRNDIPLGLERITLAQSTIRGVPDGPFDLSRTTILRNEIMSGGPPKDGIPALSSPKLITAREASFLAPADRVIGYVHGQEARAYPLKILNYHEIVNDLVGDVPVAITYCPLCDSVAIFDRRTQLGEREFGVSGLLYNSNVLMYDRSKLTESLWSQLKAEGVSGPAAQSYLKVLPAELTTWQDWRTRNPDTKVLSLETGHVRNYNLDPYRGYFERPELMFPARPLSSQLPTKERVLGVWVDGKSRAYRVSTLSRRKKRIVEELGGKRFVIESVPTAKSLRIVDADDGVQWMYSLWFAWHAFRPETGVYR